MAELYKTKPPAASSHRWSWLSNQSDLLLLAEAAPILSRVQECLDHFRGFEIAIERIQLVQPEVVAIEVQIGFRRRIRIPSQVSEVLHHHERAIRLSLLEQRVIRDLAEHVRAQGRVCGVRRKLGNESRPLRIRQDISGVAVQRIDECSRT